MPRSTRRRSNEDHRDSATSSAPREQRLLVVRDARRAAGDADLTELEQHRGGRRGDPTVADRHPEHRMIAAVELFERWRIGAHEFIDRDAMDRLDLRWIAREPAAGAGPHDDRRDR